MANSNLWVEVRSNVNNAFPLPPHVSERPLADPGWVQNDEVNIPYTDVVEQTTAGHEVSTRSQALTRL